MRILAVLALMTAPAVAMEWSDFNTLPGDQQAAFLIGAGSAYEFATAYAAANGGAEIFCAKTLDRTEFVRVSADTKQKDLPVELSLMVGLQQEYPCK